MFDSLAFRVMAYIIASFFAASAAYNLIMAITFNVTTAVAGAIVIFIISMKSIIHVLIALLTMLASLVIILTMEMIIIIIRVYQTFLTQK